MASKPLQINGILLHTLQVLCMKSLRCTANGVDAGDPSAPRSEKTTAQDCMLLSSRNQVYHDPQSSQVTCVRVEKCCRSDLNPKDKVKYVNLSCNLFAYVIMPHIKLNPI